MKTISTMKTVKYAAAGYIGIKIGETIWDHVVKEPLTNGIKGLVNIVKVH